MAIRKAVVRILVSLTLVIAPATLCAQESAPEPQDSGVKEEVTVTLVQVDAVVMDKKGRSVPDLGKDDFELRIGEQTL